jgi:CheY-like chemotaxis protein/CHAT domain-containing protein
MSKRKKVLVIEDDEDLVIPLVDILDNDYEVTVAINGQSGFAAAAEKQPDIIILDLGLPDISGIEVSRKLKERAETREIPILMLTVSSDTVEGLKAGADDYLKKPYDYKELRARLEALLRRSRKPPFNESDDICRLSLTLEPDRQIAISVEGVVANVTRTAQIINLDVARYVYKGNFIPFPQWQSQAEDVGQDLFEDLFKSHREVQDAYSRALGAVQDRHANLHIKVASTSAVIGVPIECLYEPEQRFLALVHPLSRLVLNVRTNKRTISPEFLNRLAMQNEKLKILLIASNTTPFEMGPVPGADLEIDLLSKLLAPLFDDAGIQVQLEVLPTNQASYDNVRSLLKDCSFNIVHYAGHCKYEPKTADSSLFFYEHEQRQGDIKPVGVREIESWLRNSSVNFMYLSCCSSAAHHPSHGVAIDSFLGMANAIIAARVPSVLAFRWPVSDQGALKLAETFYRSLATQGLVDTALLEARQESQISRPEESTWLAPILISQS